MQFLTPPLFDQLVNRLPKGPRLGWLTLKSRPQANGGRKNNSGHLPEHIEANKDNANPYLGEDGKWYWHDETEQACEVAYETRAAALVALTRALLAVREKRSRSLCVSMSALNAVIQRIGTQQRQRSSWEGHSHRTSTCLL
jgi:hypothetical protein